MIEIYSAEVFREIRTGNIFVDNYFIRRGRVVSRKLSIHILPAVLRDNGKGVYIPEDIQEDLNRYNFYIKEKKKVWVGDGSNKIKSRKVADLEKEFGPYILN